MQRMKKCPKQRKIGESVQGESMSAVTLCGNNLDNEVPGNNSGIGEGTPMSETQPNSGNLEHRIFEPVKDESMNADSIKGGTITDAE